MNSLKNKILGLSSDLDQLFFTKEYQALAGNGLKTIITLIIILFLTFTALGFAVGSMQQLKDKMDNPFTNWVDLSVNSSYAAKIPDVLDRYEQKDKQIEFQLNKHPKGYNRYYQQFYHYDFEPGIYETDTLLYNCAGRTLTTKGPLLQSILAAESGNLIWLDESLKKEDRLPLEGCGIIITQEMQKRLGYQEVKPKDIGNLLIYSEPEFIFLKVEAVVKELPNLSSFACSPKLYNIITGKKVGRDRCYELVNRNKGGDNTFQLFSSEEINYEQLASHLDSFFNTKSAPSFNVEQKLFSGTDTFYIYRLGFLPVDKPSFIKYKNFLSSIRTQYPLESLAEIECGVDKCEVLDSEKYHYIAFNFKEVINVRAFQRDLAETFDIEIDMSQVEAKENFALVSRLTLAISFILLAFSILSVVLFVNNLLRNHLFEVRSNLGTFQAFGLDSRFLNKTYLKIIFSFLSLATATALAMALVVDRIEQAIYLSESKFTIFHSSIFLAIIGFIMVSLLISQRTIHKILGDTPGNLIYKR